MQSRARILAAIVLLSSVGGACSRNEAGTTATDSPSATATTATTDRSADEAAIIAADSGWMRNVVAKNVDSLMSYYAPDAVSYGFGPPAVGSDQLRRNYTEMVKATMSDPRIDSNTVRFSDDGTMAYDYGTYSVVVTPPGGKPAKDSGAFLNVWKKIDGQWKIVAEMSTPLNAANQ